MSLRMLDTNVCIDIIRGKHPALLRRLNKLDPAEVALSSIVFAELEVGVHKSSDPAHNLERLIWFCIPMSIMPFDSKAAEVYGKIRAALELKGRAIGALDMLIAAHALACNATLVTANESEFRRVPGLSMENWHR